MNKNSKIFNLNFESKLWTLGTRHEWVKKSQKLGHVLRELSYQLVGVSAIFRRIHHARGVFFYKVKDVSFLNFSASNDTVLVKLLFFISEATL